MSEKKLCIYDIEEKPPIWELLTYAFQHAIAVSAFVAVVGLLIARASNVPEEMFFRIIQVGFFASGITTIVVSYLGPPLGGKLPIIYITSTGFAPACIAIGERLGWGGVLGASFIGGIFMIFLVIIFDKIKRFFPPMVTGVIIMMIGLEMLPIGVRNMAGGTVGAPDFGAPENLIVGLLVCVVCVYLNVYRKGVLSTASIFFALVVGYIASLFAGIVNFEPFFSAPAGIGMTRPFLVEWIFDPYAILLMCFMYIITTIETVGDISAVVASTGKKATSKQLFGGLMSNAVGSMFAAVFNSWPNTSSSTNIAMVGFTGVASRHVTGIAGIIWVVAALIPKVSGFFVTIPPPVLGGILIVLVGQIITIGMGQITQEPLTKRNATIVAIALGLGMGTSLTPAALQALEPGLQMLFKSGLVTGGMLAVLLNAIFPAKAAQDIVVEERIRLLNAESEPAQEEVTQ